MLRQDRREVSFQVNQNFLQSSLNKFLQENFQKIQNIENNNQIGQLYNVFQILGQEINNLKDDLTKALKAQEEKINTVNNSKDEVYKQCYMF